MDKYDILTNDIEKEFNKLLEENNTENHIWNNLYNKFAYPQIRQYGSKVEIKTRKITINLKENNIFKYNSDLGKELQSYLLTKNPNFNNLEYEDKLKDIISIGVKKNLLLTIEHYSLWINNRIYHWGPGNNWRMYGDSETDKEITNDWINSKEYGIVYFTLYHHDEIQQFCEEWNKKNKYDYKNNNCRNFVNELINYMGLLDFSL